MKIQYDSPLEFLNHLMEKEPKNDGEWFVKNYDLQDKLMLDLAVQIYCSFDDMTHEQALDEARDFLRAFFSHRYNKDTRKPRWNSTLTNPK